jgi:hypothetical protein
MINKEDKIDRIISEYAEQLTYSHYSLSGTREILCEMIDRINNTHD